VGVHLYPIKIFSIPHCRVSTLRTNLRDFLRLPSRSWRIKKQNDLVKEFLKRDLKESRHELIGKSFPPEPNVDNPRVPKIWHAAWHASSPFFRQLSAQYKITESGSSEAKTFSHGFNYVMCYVPPRGKAAREIRGYRYNERRQLLCLQ